MRQWLIRQRGTVAGTPDSTTNTHTFFFFLAREYMHDIDRWVIPPERDKPGPALSMIQTKAAAVRLAHCNKFGIRLIH